MTQPPRSVTFDDLTAGTTYYFNLYAVDYTDTGVDIVPATGDPAGTPIGYVAAEGSTLTINTSADVVLSGITVTFSARSPGTAGPRAGDTVTVESDPFPFEGDGWSPTTTTTNASGNWSKSFAPTINTRYRAFYTTVGIGGMDAKRHRRGPQKGRPNSGTRHHRLRRHATSVQRPTRPATRRSTNHRIADEPSKCASSGSPAGLGTEASSASQSTLTGLT